jgi:hypothetical protein
MILRLAEHLRLPLRDQNVLLQAAGFAPVFPERSITGPDFAAARRTIDLLLKAHEPFPALAVDRHWNLVSANNAFAPLAAGAAPWLLEPPVNVIRLSLHPEGGARQIENLGEWRRHIISRLEHQLDITADKIIADLLDEVREYPVPQEPPAPRNRDRDIDHAIAIPLRFRLGDTVLSFISTTTVFGTPVDVTLSEIAIETFLPADDDTARALAG